MSPYENWPLPIRAELEEGRISPRVGSDLVSETDLVRVWHLSLEPGERIGFHRHVLDYFWTATTDGQSRSHYADGQIVDSTYRAGDTRHFSFGQGEEMVHDLQNVGNVTLSFVTVEFKKSANLPQAIN